VFKIELAPDLESCIHTLVKSEYENTLGLLLSGEGDVQSKKKIDLLTLLLKKMDFKQLRQESEKYLIEGKNVKFTFYLEKDEPKYEMEVS